MTKQTRKMCLAGALMGLLCTSSIAQADIIADALKGAKPLVNARLRLDTASQDNRPEDAYSLTFRLRAGLETAPIKNTSVGIQFEWLEELNGDFNSTRNGRTQFPVVADPEEVELNLLYLKNTSIKDTTIIAGRQRIVYDDARFIGDVIWRQNQQTYDALRVTNTSIPNLTFDAAYVTQVNRILGRGSPNSPFEGNSVFVNAAYKTPIGKLTGFAYLLEFDNALALSTQTYGARFVGSQKAGDVKINYAASFATQSDYGDNIRDFSTEYYAAELGAGYNGFIAKIGYEQLGSDNGVGFSTPLSTAHKFQGFADLFLATPGTGVEDIYVKAGYSKKNVGPFSVVKSIFAYHNFNSAVGGLNYGDEFDFYITAKYERFLFGVKFGNYSAEDFATDTRRVTFDVNFAF